MIEFLVGFDIGWLEALMAFRILELFGVSERGTAMTSGRRLVRRFWPRPRLLAWCIVPEGVMSLFDVRALDGRNILFLTKQNFPPTILAGRTIPARAAARLTIKPIQIVTQQLQAPVAR